MKSNRLKKTGLIILLILILGQFVKPTQNDTKEVTEYDISKLTQNSEVVGIFKESCFDCHSNRTKYPWYSKVFPFSWYLYNHIEGGKKQVNFSEFGTYDSNRQQHAYQEIKETIENGEMPLSSYTMLHQEAKLTEGEKEIILSWLKEMMN